MMVFAENIEGPELRAFDDDNGTVRALLHAGASLRGAVMSKKVGVIHGGSRLILVLCVSPVWCGRNVRLCSDCDRGQRYCPKGDCAQQARAAATRRYRGDYQRTCRGRRLHAAPQARYVQRQRAPQKKMALREIEWVTPDLAGPHGGPAQPTHATR